MRTRPSILAAAVAAGALLAGCGGTETTTTASSANAATVVSATLTGAAAIPTGPEDGAGTASITLSPKSGKACWTLTVSGIGKPVSAHIHRAPSGKPGPVAIPLGDRYSAKGCVSVPKGALLAVARSPASYYVDVHTSEDLGGAVRGQLEMSEG